MAGIDFLTKLHDETLDKEAKERIYTEQDYDGTWHAYDDTYDGAPDAGKQLTGEGSTKQEAIENYLLNKDEQ